MTVNKLLTRAKKLEDPVEYQADNKMKNQKLVWDLPLRIFHWLFAISILASWYTSEQQGDMIAQHMQLGYFILGLVIFRIIWGVIGTKHSRFSSFFPTPTRIKNYLNTSKSDNQSEQVGHNPIGSLMVFLMLFLIFIQAVSGLFINDDIFSQGPYYGTISPELEKLMKFIHSNAFDLMIGAITLHIGAIVFYRVKKNTDLVTPMITGKKQIKDEKHAIEHSKIIVAILIAILVAIFVYWLVVMNAPVEEEIYY